MLATRIRRRYAGMLKARLPDLGLDQVEEVRSPRGRIRWKLATVLRTVVVAMAAACRGFGEMEQLTTLMSLPMCRMLKLPRRLPDTTARDLIVKFDDQALRACLYRQVRLAARRKALDPWGLPFGVLAIDGKQTAISAWDDRYSQRQAHSNGSGAHGVVRTLTCCLVSSRAKVCLDAVPIPPSTNEAGAFAQALDAVQSNYGRGVSFKVVVADAAQCYRETMTCVKKKGLDCVFRLKDNQPTLHAEAQRVLGPRARLAPTLTLEEVHKPYAEYRTLYISDEIAGFDGWDELRTVLRVDHKKLDMRTGQVLHDGSRIFISTLPVNALTSEQWLHLIRSYWGVENNDHNVLDTAFAEDDHPWIESDPQGVVALMLLRRMAFNLMALYRCVTQRSDERRAVAWKTLLKELEVALLAATEQDLDGLRTRRTADSDA